MKHASAEILMWVLRVFLSPTRVLAKFLIERDLIRGLEGLLTWNICFYGVIVLFYILSVGYIGKLFSFSTWVLISTALLAIWRVNELVIAFFNDALDKMEAGTSRLKLKRNQLFILLFLGYGEVIAQFGICHFCVDKLYERFSYPGSYTKSFLTVFDAAYFSGVTITTTGYGDFAPCRSFARLLTVYEAIVGIILIAMSLAAYVSFNPMAVRKRDL